MVILSQTGNNIATMESGTIQAMSGSVYFIGHGTKCDLGNYNDHGRGNDYSIAVKVVGQIFEAYINGNTYYKMPQQ